MFKLFKKKGQEPVVSDFAAELKDLFILRAMDFKCQDCPLETKNCKKLIFADRTICVAPASEVSTFKISDKRKAQFKKRGK